MGSCYTVEILTIIAVVAFCVIFLYTSSTMSGAEFSGSDNVGSQHVMNMSKNQEGIFQPLIPQWKPHGGEIESSLFAHQADVGRILVGGVFGYWIGQKKKA